MAGSPQATPIEALRGQHQQHPGPGLPAPQGRPLCPGGRRRFRWSGAGILDGDTVIIERCDTAENGAVIVALVDAQRG